MAMGQYRIVRPIAFASSLFAALGTFAPRVSAQSLEGPFRGMYVCQKLQASPDILRAPIDLVVHGGNVEFARPLFNWDGTRVVGTEMASGTIDPDGKLHLRSNWVNRDVNFEADYSGTLTPTGGTFSGTQTWHSANGITGSRTCTAAVVQTATATQSLSKQ
jgi:hypothetical protein